MSTNINAPSDRDTGGRFVPGNPHRWPPGQTGNREVKVRGASFAQALARQAVASVDDREEMAKIAQTIGLNPADA